ncbi:NAD-dependent histone deacetylase [Aureococcus anophagefferens]|nr:NAD-dependent histone deacetylase [Aureococcus anophagefferens]
MAGDEAKPADEAPDDAEAPPQPAQPQTQSLYPKFMYDSRDTPEGEQEKTLPPDELRRLALPRVLGGGVRRVAGETYPNALLTDGWPSDGLLLARSAVAERILVDRYGADRGAVGRDHPQWWPARAISIEEYLEYYATTLAKHRPKFDHVAVVFLRPWWSEHLADDGVARMFELEPAPAKATHVRPLAGSDPEPPSTPAPAADVAAGRFRDALRIAGALSGYAAGVARPEAYGNSSASPRDKKRDPPRDVSTAHVDVVNYPSVVLTLPWYEIVTKTPGDLVLADLPRSLVGADLDAGRPRGLGRSSISPLDGPPEKRPVAAEFGNMGRERSNSVRRRASRRRRGNARTSRRSSAVRPGDFDERAFRDAVRRDGAPAEAEALPPSVFRPASPTLEALPAADVTEEDSEARSSKASSESPPASPKDNPEVARAAESKDGGEEDSGGEAPMERDDDDAPPAADDAAMGDAAAPAAGGGRRGGGGGGGAAAMDAEAAAEDDDDEAAEAPPPATAAGGPRCDKCDGAHETADCPYFKKEREPSPVQNMKPVQPLSSAGLLKRRASDRSLSGQMPPASPRERPPAGKPGSPRSRSRKPPSQRRESPRLPSQRADEAPKPPSPRAEPAKPPSPPPKPPSPPPPKPPSPRAEPPPPIVQKPPRCEPAPKLASPRQRTPPPAAAGSALLCRKGCGRGFTHPPARVAHEKSCRGVPELAARRPGRGLREAGPGLRPVARRRKKRATASGDDGGGGSSGDDDASPRSDEGADDRDLRRARRERVAVLEVLEGRPLRAAARQQGRRRSAACAAATAHNDAELILTKVVAAQAAGVGGSPTRDRVAAAEARVASASRQLERGAESNGYCILNHAALGAKYAAHERGLQRVAVFDFDVHHGNGTEDVLARTCDPRFMYLSLHACGRDVYPGSGKREVPDHPGVLNLPHACEEPMTAEWCHAYAMPKVLKALDGFRPDLLILSSGFDAHKRDPVDLGRFDASDYGDLTRACVDWARRNCCGRVVSVLEGGYGVDCGPAGEYVQSGRREAFDTPRRVRAAPRSAAADRRGKAAAFFQEPPPDQSRLGAAAGPAGPQALTAAALARLGDVKPGVKLPDVADGSV